MQSAVRIKMGRQGKCLLPALVGKFYDQQSFMDVTFLLADGSTVAAHELLLAITSPLHLQLSVLVLENQGPGGVVAHPGGQQQVHEQPAGGSGGAEAQGYRQERFRLAIVCTAMISILNPTITMQGKA